MISIHQILQLKIPGYKLLSLHLPCAILPVSTSSSLSRPEGFVNRIEYCLSSEVDRSSWGDKYDVGSKPWLVGQALSAGVEEDCVGVYGGESAVSAVEQGGSSVEYPEDNFHIKLPHGVDKYTGVARVDGVDHEEFPEDSFHRKDASSSYLINQREQGVKDKWAKHEKYVYCLQSITTSLFYLCYLLALPDLIFIDLEFKGEIGKAERSR